jgi:hypothetical protein
LKEYKLPSSIFHGIPWGLTIFTIIFIQLWTTIKCQVITFTKTFIDFKIKTKRHISLKKNDVIPKQNAEWKSFITKGLANAPTF